METIHTDLKRGFLQLQNEVIDDETHFDKYEKWVWVVLARYGYTGAAFPAQKTIAAKVGISDRKVRDCLTGLQEKGWLQKIGIHEGYGTVKWIVKVPEDMEIEWMRKELEAKEQKRQMNSKKTPVDDVAKKPKKPAETNGIPYKEIIDYLNEKAGKAYRATGADTISKINGRWADGFTLEDFKRVIDVKTAEWMGTDFEQYLAPETLFRPSKFEKYANQKPVKNQNSQPTFAAPKTTGAAMTEEQRAKLLDGIDE